MPKSSIQSGAVFVPRREWSRLALGFWLLEHTLAVAGIIGAGLPAYVKLLMLALLSGSLWLSRPAASRRFLVDGAGQWALPQESLVGLELATGTRYTRWWALLRFVGPDRRRRDLPVWSDTLAPEDWRSLIIRLREYPSRARTPGNASERRR